MRRQCNCYPSNDPYRAGYLAALADVRKHLIGSAEIEPDLPQDFTDWAMEQYEFIKTIHEKGRRDNER